MPFDTLLYVVLIWIVFAALAFILTNCESWDSSEGWD